MVLDGTMIVLCKYYVVCCTMIVCTMVYTAMITTIMGDDDHYDIFQAGNPESSTILRS